MAADRYETAGDERDVARGIKRQQLTQGIDQQDAVIVAYSVPTRAASVGYASLFEQRPDTLEAIRMTRHEDGERRGVSLAHLDVCIEDHLLLAFVRTACDPHRASRELRDADCCTVRTLPHRLFHVEFDVAGHLHASGICTDRTETRCVGLV